MNKIHLHHVLPQVFASVAHLNSELWQRDVVFEKGRLYLLEAESGKGKSTFCSYLMGYRNDYAGSIRFDETDIRQFRMKDWTTIRTSHVAHLFQELRLFPELTAMENVEIKNRLTGRKSRREILLWFEQLGIADKAETLVSRMSYGQQQRVALLRALVQPFDFLIADEPISHLDDHNARLMAHLLLTEVRTQGAGLIATSIGKHLPLPYEKTLKL